MKCPHCKEFVQLTAIEDDDAGLTMEITPNEGQLLDARTVGGFITDTAKLMAATCKDAMIRTKTFVQSMETDADGKLRVRFLVTKASYKKDSETTGDRV